MYAVNILGYLLIGLSLIFIVSVLPAFFKDLWELSMEFIIIPINISITKRLSNLLEKNEAFIERYEKEYYKKSA